MASAATTCLNARLLSLAMIASREYIGHLSSNTAPQPTVGAESLCASWSKIEPYFASSLMRMYLDGMKKMGGGRLAKAAIKVALQFTSQEHEIKLDVTVPEALELPDRYVPDWSGYVDVVGAPSFREIAKNCLADLAATGELQGQGLEVLGKLAIEDVRRAQLLKMRGDVRGAQELTDYIDTTFPGYSGPKLLALGLRADLLLRDKKYSEAIAMAEAYVSHVSEMHTYALALLDAGSRAALTIGKPNLVEKFWRHALSGKDELSREMAAYRLFDLYCAQGSYEKAKNVCIPFLKSGKIENKKWAEECLKKLANR